MKTANKCFLASRETIRQEWFIVDATDKILGRLAARIAMVLMGKHKPTYTPYVDTGDYVVVLNAGKVKTTGNRKREQVIYQRYSGYPSGLRETSMATMLQRHPERVLREAVRRMLPKNALAAHMLNKLKLYVDDKHPHGNHVPQELTL